jgi:MFS transporter, DHA3 family, macrolide efflux protein
MEDGARAGRLQRLSLALLWQGQLVTSLGDALYRIALGFWLLAETGSTAITGAVLAASMLPRILLSPIAGAVVDTVSRKRILVAADVLCGAAVLLVGAAAAFGALRLWMLVAAALALGAGVAFFTPALETVLPELASRGALSRVNAAFSFACTGAALVGSSVGGFAFVALGAPALFLLDGLSFACSAVCTLFAALPPPPVVERSRSSLALKLRQGFEAVRGSPGVAGLIAASSVANLLTAGALFSVLALCEGRDDLGPAAYGLLMAALSAGAIAGYLGAAAKAIPARLRFAAFCGSGVLLGVSLAIFPRFQGVPGMLPLMAAAGFAISVTGTLFTTSLQLAVRSVDRGKVLGLRAALMTAMAPIGIAGAGCVAEVIDPAVTIWMAALGIAATYAATSLAKPVREVLRAEEEAP